jgi:TniQ
MPVGVYHRTRRRFGLQYCPDCLAEDGEPYYRRRWRLAFMTVCERHAVPLRDRCPWCGAAVNFHRGEMGDYRKFAVTSLTLCYACGHDLRESVEGAPHNDASPLPAAPAEVEFTRGLLQAADSGVMRISEHVTTYSVLYFSGLRRLLAILSMSDKRVERLRQAVGESQGVEAFSPPPRPRPDVQEMDVAARRRLLACARCLLEEWPDRFVELSRRHKVWSSVWLRHAGSDPRGRESAAPFWLWSVIHDHLYRARYCPSDEEMRAAVSHLGRKKEGVNKSKLSRLIGVAVIRREGVF